MPQARREVIPVNTRHLAFCGVILAASVGSTESFAQGRWTTGTVNVSSYPVGDEDTGPRDFFYYFVDDESFSSVSGGPLGLASLQATVGFGWMRVVGAATATAGPVGVGGYEHGRAGFHFETVFVDRLTINIPGFPGQQIFVPMGMVGDGGLSAAADSGNDPTQSFASALGVATFSLSAPSLVASTTGVVGVPPARYPGVDPAILYRDQFVGGVATVTVGVPFDVRFGVELYADVGAFTFGAPAAASMVGDFGRTFTWAGLSGLTDADGNPVTDFVVTSLSGTDYRYAVTPPPVPEPSAALLLALGLGVVSAARRCRAKVSA